MTSGDTGFGTLLRRYRLAAGLTQEALAARAGVSTRAVSDLERDPARLPRLDSVALLADALGLAPDARPRFLAAARPPGALADPAAPHTARPGLPAPAANPFTYGRPISDPARFSGRRTEVAAVFSRLRNAEFESTSLVGERRSGKTSLLQHLAHPEVGRRHGLDPARCRVVYADLQLVDRDATPEHLWRRLLRQLGRACDDPAIARALAALPTEEPLDHFALADLFDAIDDAGFAVVFLLDEFEHVTANPHFGPDFFFGLRSLAIHHRLALVTASRRELIELCHSDAIRSSPFFNIFATVWLPPLTEGEADALLDAALVGTGVAFSPAERALARRLAGRYPYLLQIAGHTLFAAHAAGAAAAERVAALPVAFAAAAAPYFADIWRHADTPERIVLTALACLGRAREGPGASSARLRALYPPAGQVAARLARRGLLTGLGGDRFALESGGFADWIVADLAAGGPPALHGAPGNGGTDPLLMRLGPEQRALVAEWSGGGAPPPAVSALLRAALEAD